MSGLHRPANFVEVALRHVRDALLIGRLLVGRDSDFIPEELAHCADFVRDDPALVADGGGRTRSVGIDAQHDDPRRGWRSRSA